MKTRAIGKSLLLSGVAVGLVACMAGCSAYATETEGGPAVNKMKQVSVKQSPDKYTWYVKNYQGVNLANIGYVSMGGDLRDEYGDSNVKLVLFSVDGSYIDPLDEEALKNYVVVDQNIKPNTEMKLEFEKDENGEEYENLVDWTSIDEIVLLVKKVGGSGTGSFDIPLTEIISSPERTTYYVNDYVGGNLASIGYVSMGGDLRDEYGDGNVKLVPVSDDGSYIDVSDIEALKQYRVVSQSVAPNTELAFTYLADYDNLIDYQSIDQIDLEVTKVTE